jgi:hypothetical protein
VTVRREGAPKPLPLLPTPFNPGASWRLVMHLDGLHKGITTFLAQLTGEIPRPLARRSDYQVLGASPNLRKHGKFDQKVPVTYYRELESVLALRSSRCVSPRVPQAGAVETEWRQCGRSVQIHLGGFRRTSIPSLQVLTSSCLPNCSSTSSNWRYALEGIWHWLGILPTEAAA